MQRVKVILNPYSGRGRGARARPRICAALEQAGVAFDLAETASMGHGVTLARDARSQGYPTVVAVGGDGTISEVMNGLAQATPPGEIVGKLGVIPLGTGNDFADMVGCARSIEAAVRVIAAGKTRRIDLGHARIHDGTEVVERYFDNNVGIGFEAWVTLESYKIKWLSGTFLYIVAALRAIRSYQSRLMMLDWESGNGESGRYAEKILLVSIGNSRRTGGGFYLTPQAQMDDGLLDVVFAHALPQWRILSLLPKALFGKHIGDPAVTMVRCRRLNLACSAGTPVHLDGEVVAPNATSVAIELQPGRLEVIV